MYPNTEYPTPIPRTNPMKVAKRFRWEAAHRLPWHEGQCKNLHGHSYAMTIELEGEPDERGMLIDFKEIKLLAKPLVDALDHSVIVAESDVALQEALTDLDSKQFILPYDTTAENLCTFVTDYLRREGGDTLRKHGVSNLVVRIEETETCYAECASDLG